MLRCQQNSIIFLINNGGYTIEVEIHDGPYNVIKNWNYTGLVDAIHNGEGKCWTSKVNNLPIVLTRTRTTELADAVTAEEQLLMDATVTCAGEVRGGADKRDRDGAGGEEGLPVLHRGDRAQG